MGIKCVLCCVVVGAVIGAVSVMIGGAVSNNTPSDAFTFAAQPTETPPVIERHEADGVGVACYAIGETAGGVIKGFSCINISESTEAV